MIPTTLGDMWAIGNVFCPLTVARMMHMKENIAQLYAYASLNQ
jgi:hypothetical protein